MKRVTGAKRYRITVKLARSMGTTFIRDPPTLKLWDLAVGWVKGSYD